jgi:hypothetical protein
VQAIFLAAYAKLHSSSSHSTTSTPQSGDAIFGIYLANRSHNLPGLPTMVAPAVNLVPLRVRSPASRSILDIAKTIQADLQDIGRVEHSCVSLLEIKEWTGVEVDVFVNFLKLPSAEGPNPQDADKRDEAGIIPEVLVKAAKEEKWTGLLRHEVEYPEAKTFTAPFDVDAKVMSVFKVWLAPVYCTPITRCILTKHV